ncbi:polyprenyl synthetase family protein [Bacteroidota bacterium]|nr:polyprenyl synthetase family protein [Bacteroidota bacterium]
MKAVEKIKKPIYREMEIFEEKFALSMFSKVPLINRITHFIVNRKGKQMRPMLIFLTAKLINEGEINERTYRGASVVELIHTATLVHDDIVDDSNFRRGFFSINALWKNKIAVLVGDFLLSKGMLICIENKDFDLLEFISVAVREMSEGELLQAQKARSFDINEDLYLKIIRKKTATLMAICCAIGAKSVNADKKMVDKLYLFGELIGITFQIRDDLFDYSENKIGKPIGIDIKDKKMTLPLIHVINKASLNDRNWILNTIKKHNKNKARVKELIKFVKEKGGVEYAKKVMIEYKSRALKMILDFPKNDFRKSLEFMLDYVIDRKY